jgi:hypothetical protein
MRELNDKAFHLVSKKATRRTLGSLLSKELIGDANNDARMRNIGHALVIDTFKRMDEYYVVNKYVGKDTIKSNLKGCKRLQPYLPGRGAGDVFYAFHPGKKGGAQQAG